MAETVIPITETETVFLKSEIKAEAGMYKVMQYRPEGEGGYAGKREELEEKGKTKGSNILG